MSRKRVLFVCTANAARSQMAEAVLRQLRPDSYEVFSAGTAPAGVDPRALKALEKNGVDTAGLHSKSLDEFRDHYFDYVIALCDKSHSECQSLRRAGEFMAWDFEDPQSSEDAAAFGRALGNIQQRIQMFLLVTEKSQKLQVRESISPTELFRCLADDTRARLVLLIHREEELCVCELTCAMDESQPKISRHLALLRNCGLLTDRRQGQWVYYRLHPELPGWVVEMLALVEQANSKWLDQQSRRLAAMGDRPARLTVCD